MVPRCPTKNLGPIGSAVLTFIGYKQTDRQTDKQTDKPNLYIDLCVFNHAFLFNSIWAFLYWVLFKFIVVKLQVHIDRIDCLIKQYHVTNKRIILYFVWSEARRPINIYMNKINQYPVEGAQEGSPWIFRH